jgi:type III restriction enzyme
MLDTHPQVELWVRNVDRTPYSYWLPTSTDRFYPDFVARLTDGRILVAEYKGADRAGSPDSLEKKNIGERTEEVSRGKLRFFWATTPSLPEVL